MSLKNVPDTLPTQKIFNTENICPRSRKIGTQEDKRKRTYRGKKVKLGNISKGFVAKSENPIKM